MILFIVGRWLILVEKKKSMYKLTFNELTKVEEEFKATHYGRSLYILSFVAYMAPFFIAALLWIESFIDAALGKGNIALNSTEVILFASGLVLCLLLRIFWYKQVKSYYDERK